MTLTRTKLTLIALGFLAVGGFVGALTQQKLATALGGISSEAKVGLASCVFRGNVTTDSA
jgi:hypothetical protein